MRELKLMQRCDGSFSVYYEQGNTHMVIFDTLDLEYMTPGGSEYHNSPQRCMDWIKRQMSLLGKIAAERNQLRSHVTMLETYLDTIGVSHKKAMIEAYHQLDNNKPR